MKVKINGKFLRGGAILLLAFLIVSAGAAEAVSQPAESEKVPELNVLEVPAGKTQDPKAAREHFLQGQEAFKNENLDQAMKEYQLALESDLAFAPAHFGLGYCLEMKGDIKGSIKEYLAAKKLDKNNFDASWRLGEVYGSLGLLDKAIQEYRTALEIDPRNIPGQLKIGLVYLQQGLYPEAGESFRAVLALDPDHRIALFNLAKCLVRTKSAREAETELLGYGEKMKSPEAKGLLEKILGEISRGQ